MNALMLYALLSYMVGATLSYSPRTAEAGHLVKLIAAILFVLAWLIDILS